MNEADEVSQIVELELVWNFIENSEVIVE